MKFVSNKIRRGLVLLAALLVVVPSVCPAALNLVGVPADTTVNCGSIPAPAAVTATGGCVTATAPTNGLLLYYSFNASNALAVADDSGNGYTGTVAGATWTAAGRDGGAYSFNGTNRISAGNVMNVGGTHSTLTVSVWTKIPTNTATAQMMLASKFQFASPYRGWSLECYQYRPTANIVATFPQQNFSQSTNSMTDNQWHHVVGVLEVGVSSLNTRVYMDGVLQATNALVGAHGATTNSVPLYFGQRDTGVAGLRGVLDEVRVYGRKLDDSEISGLAASPTGGVGSISLLQTTNGACPKIITRVWTAVDSCGETIRATQQITVVDMALPVLAGVPFDTTLYCGQSLPTAPVVTATDDCGPLPVELIEVNTGGCPSVVTRTWTAVDGCGNATSATQIITLQPASPPVLSGVPSDITVDCDQLPPPATVTATSSCYVVASSNHLLLYYSFDTSNALAVADESGNGYTGTVVGATWTNAGRIGGAYGFNGSNRIDLGNVLDVGGAQQTLSVSLWTKIPSNATVSVMMLAAKYQFAVPYSGWSVECYQRKATANIVATFPQQTISQAPSSMMDGLWHHVVGLMEVRSNALNTRVYLDGVLQNTNSHQGMHGSTVTSVPLWLGQRDSGVAGLRGMLDEIRIYGRALSGAEISALAMNAPNGMVPVSLVETTNGTCPKIVSRIWTATDACGQSVSATQRITRIDTTAPNLFGVPTSLSLYCGQSLSAPPLVTAQDDCGTLPVLLIETNTGGCPSTVTRTWSAVDGCGNSTSATQTITFQPALPPGLVGVPADIIVPCGQIPAPALVTATSGCSAAASSDGLLLYYPFDTSNSTVVADYSSSGYTGTVVGASWTAAGKYGGAYSFNGSNRINVGNVLDVGGVHSTLTFSAWTKIPSNTATWQMMLASKYQFTAPYTGWSVECYQYRATANVVGSHPQQTFSQSTNTFTDGLWHHVVGVMEVHSNALNTRTYLDGKLHQTSAYAGSHGSTVTSVPLWLGQRDTAVAGLRGLMDEVRVYGRRLSDPEIAAMAVGTSGGAVPVTLSETTTGSCPTVITRIWTATDSCGVSVSATQRINVVDTAAPTLAGVPPNQSLACGDPLPVPPVVTALDHCAGSLNVIYQQSITGTCPALVTRTWTAVDPCGNGTTGIQRIQLTAPNITNDLVLLYNFNTTVTQTVRDLSGSGYDGDNEDASWLSLHECGGAVAFDGHGRINAGNVLDLTGTRTSLTVIARIRTGTTRAMNIVGKMQDIAPFTGWGLRIAEDGRAAADLMASYPQRAVSSTPGSIADGQWHVVAGVFNVSPAAAGTKVFLDGVASGSNTWTGAHDTTATPYPLMLGTLQPNYSDPFEGVMDELRVYQRELTPAEIAAITTDMNTCGGAPARLHIVIAPSNAAAAGARWRIAGATNMTWLASGEVVDLAAGSNAVEFLAITNWTTPSNLTVSLTAGQTTVATGIYAAIVGDLVPPTIVDILPKPGSVGLGNSAVMNIFVTDNVAVASVTVNSETADLLNPGHYRADLRNIRGRFNDYLVRVTDTSGNQTQTNISYSETADLLLAALWDGTWEVSNPYGVDVTVEWRVKNDAESGYLVVPAGGTTRFTTTLGNKTVEILVGSFVVASAKSSKLPPPIGLADIRALDSDGDGYTNYEEDLAGTDPQDETSRPGLGFATGSGNNLVSAGPKSGNTLFGVVPAPTDAGGATIGEILMTIGTHAGHTYSLEYSTNILNWNPVLDFTHVPGIEGPITYTNRFNQFPIHFRIKTGKQ